MPSHVIDAALARRLKLVGLDVDGVLTDNGVYIGMVGDHPVEFKRFHIQDGIGVRMLRSAGLTVVWVSGRESAATALRARELGVDELIQDPTARKLPAFEALLARRGLTWEDCAFVGDDLSGCDAIDFVGMPLPGLPDTCVIAGDADPLFSDSELLVENLRRSRVPVDYHVFGGMPHGFSMVPFLTDGLRSLDVAAAFVRTRVAA